MVHIGLFSLVVDDYDEAIAHYCGDLGFELVEDRWEKPSSARPEGKRFVIVRPVGTETAPAQTGIVLARASDDRQRDRMGDQTGGRVGFFLHTDDFARDHAKFIAAGIQFREDPRHEDYGTVAVFQDRYGNLWDLLQPRHD